MQYQHIGHKIRGFYRIAKYSWRYLAMISKKALLKYKAIKFWQKYGLEATIDAFEVKRRTLFYWKRRLKDGNGNPGALNERSRKPRKLRQRNWPKAVIDEIKRLRKEHPNLSKEKIHPFLSRFCEGYKLTCPSARTIGRIIADMPDKMRFASVRINPKGKTIIRKKSFKVHKPKGFKAKYPGHCGAFDTIEKFIEGYRRYVITFIDIYSRFSFSWATVSHASEAAKRFFLLVIKIFPYKIDHILTDGGSEFKKAFADELKKQYKVHWHTYPRTPKMNAHCERFNRTLQEEFIDYHRDELLDDLNVFNNKMIDYLLWYNGNRPHWSLALKSPIEFLVKHNFQCNMWWPDTGN
jgi:transposase InsO family protein